MSLEAHHRFILDTLQRNQDIAQNIINKLEAENARLRKLFADTERLMLLDGEYEAAKVGTYADLKAEVERLTQLRDTASWASERAVNRLQSEVERLRKAGDAMADALSPFRVKPFPGPYLCDLQKGWEAAKEGKPSV